jgi:hypothetical protein
MILAGYKPQYSEKNLSRCTFFSHKSNPVFFAERPETNFLGQGKTY